jgi:hypothetical protein
MASFTTYRSSALVTGITADQDETARVGVADAVGDMTWGARP